MMSYYNKQKEKEKERYNKLGLGRGLDISRSISCKQRARIRELSNEITKQLKLPRNINLCKGFSPLKIAKELQMSGLSQYECRKIIKLLNEVLKDFRVNPNTLLDLSRVKLRSLPACIRRFLIALMVLKAELLNVRKIQKDFEERIRKQKEEDNNNRYSKINTEIRTPRLDVGCYKKCSTGVGLSCGDYIGPMGVGRTFDRKGFNGKYHLKQKNNKKSDENKKTYYNNFYKKEQKMDIYN